MKDMALVGISTKVPAGVRIGQKDPQHRTKGAKPKYFSHSGKPASLDTDTSRKKRSAGEEKRRARRRMRRQMERQNRYIP